MRRRTIGNRIRRALHGWARVAFLIAATIVPAAARAQAPALAGRVVDETGRALPGVSVQVAPSGGRIAQVTATDAAGDYRVDNLTSGRYDVTFSAMNFADVRRRDVAIAAGTPARLDVTLHVALSARVVVTGTTTFRNLADLERPEESLVGVAGAASEGAVTARQLEARPIMRAGEVLEAVPGVIVSQHSGEGKANQYYLRGFNLDHGTDFATTVAGLPVNMPTHAHGQGYADVNFLIPELVSGVQFRKGPYYADTGDFSAAGAANVNYANALDRSILSVSGGQHGWARALFAAAPGVGSGHLLVALELGHNDGPWDRPDDYRRVNGVVRYSRGSTQHGFSITGLAYQADWNSTDQVPARAVTAGTISRFGHIDPTDGGRTARYSVIADVQRASAATLTRASAYVSQYRLNLLSNFTYALDDPERGDQFEQADRRWTTGGRLTHRRQVRWGGRLGENAFGAELRHDGIPTVGLYRTQATQRLYAIREDAVAETSGGLFAENSLRWTPWLRTTAGLRLDTYRFAVDAGEPANGGTTSDWIASPKGSVALGPWKDTEFYVNAGMGHHSNDARGTTITQDPVTGEPASPVTPLVRATGAEVGLRSVAIPRVQTTLAVWRLSLASELVFIGDAGNTEAGRPSERYGVEWSTYVRLSDVVTADADLAWSHSRFTDEDVTGNLIPGAPGVVASVGLTATANRGLFGSLRLRYFGARPLVEDGSVESAATSLVNGQVGYHLGPNVHVVLDAFNIFDAKASDIDYFYTSRLPGEPAGGIDDIHSHPTLPRSMRLILRVQF